jgi:hypothetical protein
MCFVDLRNHRNAKVERDAVRLDSLSCGLYGQTYSRRNQPRDALLGIYRVRIRIYAEYGHKWAEMGTNVMTIL